jgi:hypothetical protein
MVGHINRSAVILYRLGWHGHRIESRLRDDLSVLCDRCYNLALRLEIGRFLFTENHFIPNQLWDVMMETDTLD